MKVLGNDKIQVSHGDGQRFAMIPWGLQDAKWKTGYTISVYAALKRYVDFGGINGARPSHKTLSEKSGVSLRQLSRELELLKNHGWVDWKRTQTTCDYIVFSDLPSRQIQTYKQLDFGSSDLPIGQSGFAKDDSSDLPIGHITKSHYQETLPEPIPIEKSEIKPKLRFPITIANEEPFEIPIEGFNLAENIILYFTQERYKLYKLNLRLSSDKFHKLVDKYEKNIQPCLGDKLEDNIAYVKWFLARTDEFTKNNDWPIDFMAHDSAISDYLNFKDKPKDIGYIREEDREKHLGRGKWIK